MMIHVKKTRFALRNRNLITYQNGTLNVIIVLHFSDIITLFVDTPPRSPSSPEILVRYSSYCV